MSISLNSAQEYWQVLTFPFRSREAWKRITIGVLMSLLMFAIPLLPGVVVCGYSARVMKRIVHEDGDPDLPEWDNWAALFQDGLRVLGASILISLPLILLMLASLGIAILPWLIFPATAAESGSVPNDSVTIALILTVIGFVGFLLTLALSLPLALMQAPILGHVVAQDSFQAMFRVKEWWSILRAGWSIFLLETLVVMALAWLGNVLLSLSTATILLCFLYPFLLALYIFLLTLYNYTFIALAYRAARKRLLAQGR